MVWHKKRKTEDALTLQAEILERLDPAKFQYRHAVVSFDYIQFLAIQARNYIENNQIEPARQSAEKARQAAAQVQNSPIEPHRRLLIEANLAFLDELLAADIEEKKTHLLRQLDLLNQANASAPEWRGQEKEVIQSHLISVLSRLDLTSEVVPIARQRLAQEQAFLRMSPSLVDYYNYCNEMRQNWDILVRDSLNHGEIDTALA